jgi:hypothetical protein
LQIRKFAGLQKFVRLAELPQMWNFADLQFANPIFCYDLGTQLFSDYETFAKTEIP